MKKRKKKNINQGDLLNGFESAPKSEGDLTVEAICKIFGGRVVTERQAEIESKLIAAEAWMKKALKYDESQHDETGVYVWEETADGDYICHKLAPSEGKKEDDKEDES